MKSAFLLLIFFLFSSIGLEFLVFQTDFRLQVFGARLYMFPTHIMLTQFAKQHIIWRCNLGKMTKFIVFIDLGRALELRSHTLRTTLCSPQINIPFFSPNRISVNNQFQDISSLTTDSILIGQFCDSSRDSAEITGRFLSVQPAAWKLDIPRHIRHNKLHFWNYDYQGSQANVRCWYSEPLEIWQMHPLASPSSTLLLIGWSVNNFVVAEPRKPAVLASGRKKITDKTNKHLYQIFFPGFFFFSLMPWCQENRKMF